MINTKVCNATLPLLDAVVFCLLSVNWLWEFSQSLLQVPFDKVTSTITIFEKKFDSFVFIVVTRVASILEEMISDTHL